MRRRRSYLKGWTVPYYFHSVRSMSFAFCEYSSSFSDPLAISWGTQWTQWIRGSRQQWSQRSLRSAR